jgi:hypothetical protein
VDIDGDGDLDIISTSYVDRKLAWYENTDGQGTFTTEHEISSSAYKRTLTNWLNSNTGQSEPKDEMNMRRVLKCSLLAKWLKLLEKMQT